MVFSTSARKIRLVQDEEGNTLLQAGLKTNSGDWKPASHLLDYDLALSPQSPGLEVFKDPPGNATMESFFEPSSLQLSVGSVLCGKIRAEWGGWEISVCLDVVYTNNNGDFERILGPEYASTIILLLLLSLGR